LEQTGSGNHSSQLGMFHLPQLVALAEFAVLFLEFALRFRYGWGLGRRDINSDRWWILPRPAPASG